ncbi:SusC/RagA family TonB-linked outer membrane protein [Chitinophaga agrisoli]|uniref:SusC/RagA family TonB-linked outer membrane protein n=1 Tax=Chitinophaga agrisoli TaxID=2607653 RepID=A0A5B2VUA0_9BACT|nr:SusC/RagA family TonB-linked outer membrane protein [Chitinophaga agrisoli]KAA2241827.1 SusC/RagA family TonB-linked outer membrane protein [Chitinophaga agrisoli]
MNRKFHLSWACRPTSVLLCLALAGGAHMQAIAAIPTFAHTTVEQDITGTVRDAQGTPLPGVTVQVKGINKGTQTDANGVFKISANPGDVLVFSSLGFTATEVTLGNNPTINVTLEGNVKGLNELVVTALGVKKTPKALTYATQRIDAAEITTAKDPNLMNALNGKVSGINISRSSSGAGGSVKVIMRGNKSAASTNQPLYVIDGIPMISYATQQPNSTWGGNGVITYAPGRDGGDVISNLNPDDVESISVLKGASASALYGSQAANGVILITSKKGKPGQTNVSLSSSFTMDQVAIKPEFQNSYGQDPKAATQSWGPSLTGGAADNLKDFFRTGNTWINSIGLSGGTEKMQTYFSYANTRGAGTMPGNDFNRHNITFRETGHFLDNKLTIDGGAQIVVQKIKNAPVTGLYFNPLSGLYLFPRGLALQPYRDKYTAFNELRQIDLQNWPFNEDIQQNPWWIVNRNTSSTDRNRTLFNASAKYDITDWLNIQARGSMDRINDTYDAQIYAGTQGVLSGPNGRYIALNSTTTQFYGDLLLSLNRDFGDFRLNAVLGSSIVDMQTKGFSADSYNGSLYVANVFTLQNMSQGSQYNTLPNNHVQIQAVFGNATLSWKDLVFLDLTSRSDWPSTLSFTPTKSYFYPSVGLSFIMSDILHLPEPISYAKLRGSYSSVGNSVPAYVTNPLSRLGTVGGTFDFNTVEPNPDLKPERTKSFELGTELRFLQNRLSVDVTYYKTNTVNQYFQIAIPPGTGYSLRNINAGEIQNSGVEALVNYNVIKSGNFQWNTGVNYSYNKNTVKSLAPDMDQFILTDANSNSYSSVIKVGGSYGDIYGTVLQRDEQNRVIIGADGTPKVDPVLQFIGNPNPKWQLGWSNGFSFKNFNLNVLVDGKFGGKVLSITQAMMDQYGVSKESGDARANGGVNINGVQDDAAKTPVTSVDAKKWYTTIGGRAGVAGEYVYSGDVIRMREVSLGYALPSSLLEHSFVKGLKLSLIGRNLFYFSKKAPYDPEVTMSTGNGLSGVDVFSLPATRSLGVNLNVNF